MVFIIFTATLSDLLEQLMDIRADTTGPERLVREAAQGHADAVKDIVTKHPDKVSSAMQSLQTVFTSYSKGEKDKYTEVCVDTFHVALLLFL